MRVSANFSTLLLALLFTLQVRASPVFEARQNSTSATATTSSSSSISSYNAATDTQSGVPAGVGTGSSGSGEGSSGQNSNTSTSSGVVRYAVSGSVLSVVAFGVVLLVL